MPILAVLQAPLSHAKSDDELTMLRLRLECYLQHFSCFNMALTARARAKNNLYEHSVKRGLIIYGLGLVYSRNFTPGTRRQNQVDSRLTSLCTTSLLCSLL